MDCPPEEQNTLWETVPATPEAERWDGWSTGLKPAYEPIMVARKPFTGSAAANILAWGTGALHVDACRIRFAGPSDETESKAKNQHGDHGARPRGNQIYGADHNGRLNYDAPGRWPADLIIDGSEEVLSIFPTSDKLGSKARFFYCAKASKAERAGSKHPTIKPLDLMRYLVRLVTPPGGLILDPFAGSGTTGRAAIEEGFSWLGMELDRVSIEEAQKRLDLVQPGLKFGVIP